MTDRPLPLPRRWGSRSPPAKSAPTSRATRKPVRKRHAFTCLQTSG